MKGAGGLFRSWKWRLASLNFGMGELNYYDSDTIEAECIKGNGTVVGVEDVADNKGHRSNRFNIKVRDHSAHGASAVLDVCTKTPQEKLAWIAAVHKVISTAEKTARVDALRAQLEPPRPKPAEGTSSTLDRVVLQERSEALAGTPQADEADKILGQLVASASTRVSMYCRGWPLVPSQGDFFTSRGLRSSQRPAGVQPRPIRSLQTVEQIIIRELRHSRALQQGSERATGGFQLALVHARSPRAACVGFDTDLFEPLVGFDRGQGAACMHHEREPTENQHAEHDERARGGSARHKNTH